MILTSKHQNKQYQTGSSVPFSSYKLKAIAFAMLVSMGTQGLALDEPADVSAPTVISVETTHQIRDAQLLLRIQQKIDADSREIDAMALRIKEMIRHRHNSDALNQQASRQIEQLQEQLADLLADRQNAENRWKILLSEKQDLQKQIDALRDKHSDNRANLASMAGAARQRDSAIAALGNDIDNARSELQDKQAEIAELANQLGNVQGKYDDAQGRIADLNAALANAKNKADGLLAERTRLSGELGNIQGKYDDMQGRNAALNADLKKATDKADGLLAERSRLSGELDSMQSQQGDSNVALSSERDAHANALKDLAALKNEFAAMQNNLANANQEIEVLQNARDALSQDKSLLQASASDLDSQLQYLQSELDNRVTEIQAANSEFVNLDDRLAETNTELARAKGRIADANGRIGNLKAELALLNSDHNRALQDNEALQAQIASLKSDIAEKQLKNDALASGYKDEHARQAGVIASLEGKIDALIEKNHNAEKQQLALQGEFESRLSDIDHLNKQLAALNSDNAAALESHQLLNAGNQDLNQKNNKLQSALAALQQKNKKIVAERNKLGSLRDALSTERDGLVKERDSLLKERDARLAQLNTLASVRNELAAERDGIAVERDSIEEALSALNAERNSLINAVNNLKSERQTIAAESGEFSDKAKQLAATVEEQSDIIKVLDAHIVTLEAAATDAENSLALVRQQSAVEAGKLRQQLASTQRELDDSNDRLQALLLENKNIENERNQLITDAEALRKSLTDELTAAELNFVTVQKAREDSSIPLRLGSADFFATGSSELTAEGRENLQKLADIIAKFEDRRIVVAGHTDSKKIGQRLKSRYFSNWELSVARAASAVRFMQHKSNIDPINLSASGFSEYYPVADNATPEGRQMNRRVEVILYPRHLKEKHYSVLEE